MSAIIHHKPSCFSSPNHFSWFQGFWIEPYVLCKTALRLREHAGVDGFLKREVTHSDVANVKPELLTTADDAHLKCVERQLILCLAGWWVLSYPTESNPLIYSK